MKKWVSVLMILMLLCVSTAWGEEKKTMFDEEWYRQALRDSVMSVGNNARLKKVIERAQSGEVITLATIGGSITEGAGASSYKECWASRFHIRFRTEYGAANGSNVCFVNAGVGGTPSPFGYMRYQREVVNRVPAADTDGLPDVVVIEFSVNDWEEPTKHRCFESMVKEILDAPNEPAVILLFAVFRNGFNLQNDLRRIGKNYDLMMVSIKDGFYGHFGKELKKEGFFSDEYHPTSLGHRIMTDCLMQAVTEAAEAETDAAPDLDVKPVYGTDFMGLKTIFGDTETEEFTVDRGGFPGSDSGSYHNQPVGWVCGKNFYHNVKDPMDPLTVRGIFRKCLVAWKATNSASFGAAEILIDGRVVKTVKGGKDKWGQSEVVLVLDEKEAAEHTLEIRVTEEGKAFTVTAIGLQ
ncbi:SGNH/GDSL hydrolase family protein [Aristaeella lactis]|uniref:Lysophospholipase L1 n=1 Tax=Aristaeella lactis TaxID=3046383 RepID=A0AC61PMM6_9FIRM|nr:SGNH/GDSL hydrolase family protein [Aristaeella lactis]QUA52643.1 SGNH/GDSL hydrolase family protein [Aristaeella lactis]SMC71157.1 Lysophospholipase L1 [Aristaeella lactis]